MRLSAGCQSGRHRKTGAKSSLARQGAAMSSFAAGFQTMEFGLIAAAMTLSLRRIGCRVQFLRTRTLDVLFSKPYQFHPFLTFAPASHNG